MSKSKKLINNNTIQYSRESKPDSLKDHVFYGLSLDKEQAIFRDAIWDNDTTIVLCNAKAGTGKTTIALGVANLLVQYGLYNGIIYIMFPTMEQKQGYLPGGLEEKNEPYKQPLKDACYTLGLDPNMVIISDDNMQAQKDGTAYINFQMDTFMRGVNFENKVIIVDEMQNGYFDQCKKVLTRIHDNCKVICLGHDKQCDILKHSERSGFSKYIEAFKSAINEGEDRAKICELTINHRGWLSTFCDNVEFD